MCGIVGCVSAGGSATEVLISGLRRLEYRGYDSAGIAVLDEERSGIRTLREVGRIQNLESALNGVYLHGRTGIGHTRWATHGSPSERNAHPHGDCRGDLVVVHNGIIENYRSLRDDLVSAGHVFTSETDSEVLAHLIEAEDHGDLAEAVRRALRRVEGSWAVAVIHRGHPGLIIGARKDSPLVIGIAASQSFLASDVPALLDRTKDVIYLEDGDVASLRETGVAIRDAEGRPVERKVVRIGWDVSQAERGGYPHFMLKEIHEQPRVVSDTLLGRIATDRGDVVLDDAGITDEDIRRLRRISIVACGTSWHAGQVARFYFERFARMSVDVDYASEYRYRDAVTDADTMMIAVSQSGETADTLAALRQGRRLGARTLAVCNAVGSSIVRESDGVILTHAGPEIGVASTKAFVTQLVALLLVALRFGRVRGAVAPATLDQGIDALRSLPGRIERALLLEPRIRDLAPKYAAARDVLFIGRGINYPIALEGALKLKEISYIHAEGYPAGEMKHGPIALVDAALPIVAIATRSAVHDKMLSNIEEARARGGRVIAVASEGDERIRALAEDVIEVPDTPEALSPAVNVVPLQLLAYHMAVLRGCDVDRPRNLAKSVTVE